MFLDTSNSRTTIETGWWFQTFLPCHPSHWRTHIFQRGWYTTNQMNRSIPSQVWRSLRSLWRRTWAMDWGVWSGFMGMFHGKIICKWCKSGYNRIYTVDKIAHLLPKRQLRLKWWTRDGMEYPFRQTQGMFVMNLAVFMWNLRFSTRAWFGDDPISIIWR